MNKIYVFHGTYQDRTSTSEENMLVKAFYSKKRAREYLVKTAKAFLTDNEFEIELDFSGSTPEGYEFQEKLQKEDASGILEAAYWNERFIEIGGIRCCFYGYIDAVEVEGVSENLENLDFQWIRSEHDCFWRLMKDDVHLASLGQKDDGIFRYVLYFPSYQPWETLNVDSWKDARKAVEKRFLKKMRTIVSDNQGKIDKLYSEINQINALFEEN